MSTGIAGSCEHGSSRRIRHAQPSPFPTNAAGHVHDQAIRSCAGDQLDVEARQPSGHMGRKTFRHGLLLALLVGAWLAGCTDTVPASGDAGVDSSGADGASAADAGMDTGADVCAPCVLGAAVLGSCCVQ
jgi:hypothetical protein